MAGMDCQSEMQDLDLQQTAEEELDESGEGCQSEEDDSNSGAGASVPPCMFPQQLNDTGMTAQGDSVRGEGFAVLDRPTS